MPVLDGDGNAVPGAGSSNTGSGTGSLAINTSKKKQGYGAITPQYIVIHNTAGGTASSNADWFCSGAGGSGNCTQFITDDKEIYQIMSPTQKARHIQGSNTGGGKGCASWASSNAPALSVCGATNSNSIGIEVADGYNPNTNTYDSSKVDMAKAVELTIELTRYLMTQYNIPIENVVRHGDTHNKPCPNRIMELSLWPYFKEQCTKRNQENKPVSFNPSTLDTSSQPVSVGGGATATLVSTGSSGTTLIDTPLYASPTDIEVQLPDVDHRENTTNMDEVKGLTFIYYPPYNACEAGAVTDHFANFNYDRDYHFIIGKGNAVYQPAGSSPEASGPGEVVDPEDGETEGDTGEGEAGGEAEIINLRFKTSALARSNYIAYVGDSLTVGINNAVPSTQVFATTGHTVGQGYDVYADDIVKAKPLVVIMSYGTNDAVDGNTSTFVTNYKKFIKKLKDEIPNVQIFINTILPGNPSKPKCTANYKKAIENIPDFNAVLSDIASAGATVIDTTGAIDIDADYSDDGLHLTTDGYKTWHQEIQNQINNDNEGEEGTEEDTNTSTEIPEGDPVGGNKELETVEGYNITAIIPEERQSKGFTDNDTHTYIDRALFKNKREKHNLTVAMVCPSDVEDYPSYEKALIESLSIILHEHALSIKDLWREFDLNRAPSPFLYLDRDAWKDLLTEVEKQLNWRIEKYGAYTKEYYPYTAGSSGLSGGSTGSIGTPSTGISPGGSVPGGSTPNTPITGDTEMKSENEVVNTCYATFIRLGCTPEAACGIIGNMQQESSLRPSIINYKGASGLCQWLYDRLTGLKNYASSKGTQWTDVVTQCEWCIEEIKGKDPTTKSFLASKEGLTPEQFMQLTDLSRAVSAFRRCFERCGESEANDAKRLKYAQNWYNQVAQKTDSGTVLPPGIGDDDLEVASFGLRTTTVSPRTATVFGWPLPGCSKVSSKFGPRVPPCPGASDYHGGIDIGDAPRGTPILCYASGTVEINKKLSGAAGNYIKIDHGNGIASRYLHMDAQSPLAVGTQVAAGQEVGKVGSTGVGTGVHLHFEIWVNGEKKDPLTYVTPGGGTTGAMTQLGENGTPSSGSTGGGGTPGSGTTGTPVGTGGNGGSIGTVGGNSSGLLYDDQKQQNTNAPISGNSAGGQNHDDWGGKMVYKKGEPTNASAEQPEILPIITQEMFEEIIQYSDFKLVDDYVMDFEPYSKGLASVDDNQITNDDRISAMTKQFKTSNENTFHYKVIESGPGSKDHCVTIAEELNYLAIPDDITVEPIYPDLVIPPGYVSTDVDESSPNSIPIAVIEESGVTSSDSFTKQMSFDYDLLKEKRKESNKTHHPVNYTDPYPYDEKITDLERHYPKVFIDEIEGQLYSCNHPGCPISQPMAKNFAMVSDAMMNQSKRVEKRLSRIENILSTIIRNQGRLGARMNINCVYYGGHSSFNKYKCIRCLHDDRVHDGELVTIDQCLNCTRFEPILGQVYRILDDSGLNGSIILDDMQMSYTDLEGFKNLNDITHRSSRYFNAMATEETNCVKPTHTLIDIWKEADKQQAIATIRAESTDESEAQSKIDALTEEDYIFKMNWAETFFNSQEPDTKQFPNEGIVARQKADVSGDGEETLEDYMAELDPTMDADVIEEIKELIKIRDNVWVDTRNQADSIQVNKYSSENFFFEDFNKVRIGKYGIKFSALYNYNGEDYNNIYTGAGSAVFGGGGGGGVTLLNGTNPGSAFASNVRDKIVEMAKKILQDCNDGKAWYSQPYRTLEYDKPVTIKAGNGVGKTGYDCTSFVSCCYMYAGLKSMHAKSCSGGSLVREIQKGGKMIPCNKDNMQYILPGDILLTASGTVTQNDCNQLKFITTSHAAIYVGNNQIIHARGKDKGIQASTMDYYLSKSNYFFVRPADLLAADLAAAQQQQTTNPGGGSGVNETSGTINGKSYVAQIPQAVVTAYTGSGAGASGMGCVYNSTCASHNMPYGTKIYVPGLAGKAGDGVFTVTDTGGCFFDFDIFTNTWSGKTNMDAYVLEWGTGKTAASYTWAINYYLKNGRWSGLIKPWNTYKNMNGKLMNFTKYNQEDATIKSHPNYND